MKRSFELERRRVARLTEKRPAVRVEVSYAPSPAARDRLLDLLLELLDPATRSGAR